MLTTLAWGKLVKMLKFQKRELTLSHSVKFPASFEMLFCSCNKILWSSIKMIFSLLLFHLFYPAMEHTIEYGEQWIHIYLEKFLPRYESRRRQRPENTFAFIYGKWKRSRRLEKRGEWKFWMLSVVRKTFQNIFTNSTSIETVAEGGRQRQHQHKTRQLGGESVKKVVCREI